MVRVCTTFTGRSRCGLVCDRAASCPVTLIRYLNNYCLRVTPSFVTISCIHVSTHYCNLKTEQTAGEIAGKADDPNDCVGTGEAAYFQTLFGMFLQVDCLCFTVYVNIVVNLALVCPVLLLSILLLRVYRCSNEFARCCHQSVLSFGWNLLFLFRPLPSSISFYSHIVGAPSLCLNKFVRCE